MLLKTAIEMIEHHTAGFKNANPSVCIEVFRPGAIGGTPCGIMRSSLAR